MSLLKFAAILLGTAGSAAAHGYVTSIDVDGTTYGGYLIDTYYYESDPPELIAWSTAATDDGYVSPTAYQDSDIICHRGAEPGALSAEIAPGGSVTMFWSTWPDDHHGPVITYLANCNGDCASVDKTTLEFFKIDAGGLIDDTTVPGTWASDELIAANYSRTITIPTDIESGNYVLRHEIIALHGAETLDGAQNYPQCINLKVTGSGTATPSGTLGTALYKDTDPGIYVNIWQAISSYVIPGPALYTAGSTATTGSEATSTTVAATTPTTTAAATSTTTTAVVVPTSASTTATSVVTSSVSTAGDNTAIATKTESQAPTGSIVDIPTGSAPAQPTAVPSQGPGYGQPGETPSASETFGGWAPTGSAPAQASHTGEFGRPGETPAPTGTSGGEVPPTGSFVPAPTGPVTDLGPSTERPFPPATSQGSVPPAQPTGTDSKHHHHSFAAVPSDIPGHRGGPGHFSGHGHGKHYHSKGGSASFFVTDRKHARDLSI